MSKPIPDLQLFNDLCAVEDTLMECGWCKGRAQDDNGRVCLIGAAAQLCGVSFEYDDQTKDYRRYRNIIDAVATEIRKRPPTKHQNNCETWACTDIAAFNDNPNTTIDDVRGKLREAREALL